MSVRNTQGPWKAVEYQAGDCWQIQYGDRGNWLAEVVIDGDEPSAEADARLIAAAPDLLDALHRLLATTDSGNSATHQPDCRCVFHEARAAIAKATEEAS